MRLAHAEGFDISDSLAGLNRQSTNCYPKHFQIVDPLSGEPATDKQLYATPGLHLLNNDQLGDISKANRGSTKTADVPYFVNGTTFYRLNADFSITEFASPPIKGNGQVSMSDNGKQVLIISPSAGEGYIFDVDANTLSLITDLDFQANGKPQHGIYVNSFFAVTTDTKRWIISAINDGTSWDVFQFGTAESDPDAIVAPVNFKDQVYILGTETVEGQSFSPSGTKFPYVQNNFILDKGLFAPFSVEKSSNTFMFIGGAKGEQPAIWGLQGTSLVKISNTGVDLKLGALTAAEIGQVTSFTYMEDSSFFIGWRLPNETIVYETTTAKWHLRRSIDLGLDIGWRAINLITAYNKLICFDAIDGRVGEISNDFFDEYGEDIHREFDIQPIRLGQSFAIPRVEAQIEAGVGGQTDPILRVQTSRDGQKFGPDRQLLMGKIGERLKRLVARRLGHYPQYCALRFRCSEQVKFVIIRIEAEVIGGDV